MSDFFKINIVEIGLFVTAVAYIYTNWKNGTSQSTESGLRISKEVMDAYEKRISQLQTDVGEVKGKLMEKEDRLKTLESVLPGSTDQIQYQQDIRNFTAKVAEYMDKSTTTLLNLNARSEEQSIAMKEQTAIMHQLYELLILKNQEIKKLRGKASLV